MVSSVYCSMRQLCTLKSNNLNKKKNNINYIVLTYTICLVVSEITKYLHIMILLL